MEHTRRVALRLACEEFSKVFISENSLQLQLQKAVLSLLISELNHFHAHQFGEFLDAQLLVAVGVKFLENPEQLGLADFSL